MSQPGLDPDRGAERLRRRFQAVTARRRRQDRAFRLARWFVRAAPILLVTAGLAVGGFMVSPWPPWTTVKHLLAFPNCASARSVDLAPARRGEPGYYARHDADGDGIACEPWPR